MGLTSDDVHISYLPLAHMMERLVQVIYTLTDVCIYLGHTHPLSVCVCLCLLQLFLYSVGGACGFYRGDVKELVNDIQALRPTLFVSVPRLLNRVYDKVRTAVFSGHVLHTPNCPGHNWSVCISC